MRALWRLVSAIASPPHLWQAAGTIAGGLVVFGPALFLAYVLGVVPCS